MIITGPRFATCESKTPRSIFMYDIFPLSCQCSPSNASMCIFFFCEIEGEIAAENNMKTLATALLDVVFAIKQQRCQYIVQLGEKM